MKAKIYGKILVVDDQESWRELLAEILEEQGHKIVTVATFESAFEVLKTELFDVAIIDMRLVNELEYNIQGMEVLKEAKHLQPSIKAIVLTGYPNPDQKSKALEYYRADAFWEKAPQGKPFNIDQFNRSILQLLQS